MKEILIIGAGFLMVPTVKVAKSMGLRVTVVDRNTCAPAVSYADDVLVASTYEPQAVVSEIKKKGWTDRFNAVFTAGADVEVTVAEVAEALGLPGIPPVVARRCNDKALMKECLDRGSVPTPASVLVSSEQEAAGALKKTGLPAIVKPLSNCGSRGVARVDREEDIQIAFADAMKYSVDKKLLVESFLRGTTHTVEMIAWRGDYHVASIIDTVHGFEPHFVELYHVNPTRRSAEECARMVELARKASKVIGIHQGAAKVDIIYSDKGPQVMEMTARLSGGFHCQYTTPLACGTNNIRAAIRIALGEEPDMKDIIPQKSGCAISRALFPAPGVIKKIRGLDEARRLEGVAEIFLLKKEGETVGPYRNSADRSVYVIAHGRDEKAVWSTLTAADRTLSIDTAPAA